VELIPPVFVHHGIGNPGEDIFTISYLGIHHPVFDQHFTCIHVTQVCRNCGGSYIYAYPVPLLHKTGPDIDYFPVIQYGGSYFPVLFPHYVRKVPEHKIVHLQVFQAKLLLKGILQPSQVITVVFQGCFGHLYIVVLHCRVKFKHPFLTGI